MAFAGGKVWARMLSRCTPLLRGCCPSQGKPSLAWDQRRVRARIQFLLMSSCWLTSPGPFLISPGSYQVNRKAWQLLEPSFPSQLSPESQKQLNLTYASVTSLWTMPPLWFQLSCSLGSLSTASFPPKQQLLWVRRCSPQRSFTLVPWSPESLIRTVFAHGRRKARSTILSTIWEKDKADRGTDI